MLITYGGTDGDLVERDPAFGVLLAIIFPKLLKLEIPWPNNLSEMRSKLFETWGTVFSVILDVAHVLVGLAVIRMTSDATADVTRRKTMMEIMRRILVDLLILIAAMIVVVLMNTSTTFLTTLIATAADATATATTTWGLGGG
jgi:phage-related holin